MESYHVDKHFFFRLKGQDHSERIVKRENGERNELKRRTKEGRETKRGKREVKHLIRKERRERETYSTR